MASAPESSVRFIMRSFAAKCPQVIEDVSVVKLASKCNTGAIGTEPAFDGAESALVALKSIVEELYR
jgi:hypothetical protein